MCWLFSLLEKILLGFNELSFINHTASFSKEHRLSWSGSSKVWNNLLSKLLVHGQQASVWIISDSSVIALQVIDAVFYNSISINLLLFVVLFVDDLLKDFHMANQMLARCIHHLRLRFVWRNFTSFENNIDYHVKADKSMSSRDHKSFARFLFVFDVVISKLWYQRFNDLVHHSTILNFLGLGLKLGYFRESIRYVRYE